MPDGASTFRPPATFNPAPPTPSSPPAVLGVTFGKALGNLPDNLLGPGIVSSGWTVYGEHGTGADHKVHLVRRVGRTDMVDEIDITAEKYQAVLAYQKRNGVRTKSPKRLALKAEDMGKALDPRLDLVPDLYDATSRDYRVRRGGGRLSAWIKESLIHDFKVGRAGAYEKLLSIAEHGKQDGSSLTEKVVGAVGGAVLGETFVDKLLGKKHATEPPDPLKVAAKTPAPGEPAAPPTPVVTVEEKKTEETDDSENARLAVPVVTPIPISVPVPLALKVNVVSTPAFLQQPGIDDLRNEMRATRTSAPNATRRPPRKSLTPSPPTSPVAQAPAPDLNRPRPTPYRAPQIAMGMTPLAPSVDQTIEGIPRDEALAYVKSLLDNGKHRAEGTGKRVSEHVQTDNETQTQDATPSETAHPASSLQPQASSEPRTSETPTPTTLEDLAKLIELEQSLAHLQQIQAALLALPEGATVPTNFSQQLRGNASVAGAPPLPPVDKPLERSTEPPEQPLNSLNGTSELSDGTPSRGQGAPETSPPTIALPPRIPTFVPPTIPHSTAPLTEPLNPLNGTSKVTPDRTLFRGQGASEQGAPLPERPASKPVGAPPVPRHPSLPKPHRSLLAQQMGRQIPTAFAPMLDLGAAQNRERGERYNQADQTLTDNSVPTDSSITGEQGVPSATDPLALAKSPTPTPNATALDEQEPPTGKTAMQISKAQTGIQQQFTGGPAGNTNVSTQQPTEPLNPIEVTSDRTPSRGQGATENQTAAGFQGALQRDRQLKAETPPVDKSDSAPTSSMDAASSFPAFFTQAELAYHAVVGCADLVDFFGFVWVSNVALVNDKWLHLKAIKYTLKIPGASERTNLYAQYVVILMNCLIVCILLFLLCAIVVIIYFMIEAADSPLSTIGNVGTAVINGVTGD